MEQAKVYRIYSKVEKRYWSLDDNANEFTRELEEAKRLLSYYSAFVTKFKLVIQEYTLTNEKEII